MSVISFFTKFAIQILSFELVFFWEFSKRSHFWLRLIPSATVYCVLSVLLNRESFFLLGGWFPPVFLLIILLSGLLMWFLFNIPIRQIVFYVCVAHTLQHITHCFYQVLAIALNLNDDMAKLIYFAVELLLLALSWFVLRKRIGENESVDIKPPELIVFALVTSAIVYYLSVWCRTFESETIGLFLFDALACCLILIILLDMLRFHKAEQENLTMMRILQQEQEQHEISKATIETINRKCHDLKHQISAMRHMSEQEQKESISELEKSILIYDSFPKSGNKDLDIILAEKNLLCEGQGIRLQCIADGSALYFMNTEDIYILIGNALDNAIESVVRESSPGRRIISIRITRRDELLTIHMENPCKTEPVFVDGLPLTTKANDGFHGFGSKSMRYVSEKYGGAMAAAWENGIFYLDMLFPLR